MTFPQISISFYELNALSRICPKAMQIGSAEIVRAVQKWTMDRSVELNVLMDMRPTAQITLVFILVPCLEV